MHFIFYRVISYQKSKKELLVQKLSDRFMIEI